MIGRRITFNELLVIAKSMKCEANLSLYLPTWLPDGYRLSAIWVKGRNKSEWAFPIILIYSKDNYTGYSARSGVVSFEISPAGISASRLWLQIKKFNASCDYVPIMISDDVYGIVYLHIKRPLAILYVKGLNYMIDSDNIDYLLRIVRSLKPIEQIAQD